MWEIIDSVIDENIKENEAIESMKMLDKIVIKYARISDHKLYSSKIEIENRLMRVVTIPTLRLIIVEVINHLREKED